MTAMLRSPLAIACFLTLAGCTHRSPCGAGATKLELRDGSGALELRVAAAAQPGTLDLCDAGGQRKGMIVREGEALRLVDAAHAERLRADKPGALELAGPKGQVLRLSREPSTVRVLHPDGIPYASLYETPADIRLADASGAPVGKVAPRDDDAVLSGPDGAVKGYVVPSPGLSTAALLAVPGLSVEERVFLAVHLGRGALLP